MNLIEVTNVSKTFGKGEAAAKVLNNVSLNVAQGEFVSLMGASGSGKSTLLYLIGGLDRDFDGTIKVCGKDITKMKERELSKLRLETIGFIFQFYNLVQNLSVEDNILLPELTKGRTRAELKKDLDEILEITGLSDKRKSMPNELSGGQQQRTAVARAVIAESGHRIAAAYTCRRSNGQPRFGVGRGDHEAFCKDKQGEEHYHFTGNSQRGVRGLRHTYGKTCKWQYNVIQ